MTKPKKYTFEDKLGHLLFEYHFSVDKALRYSKALTRILKSWNKGDNSPFIDKHPLNHKGLGCE